MHVECERDGWVIKVKYWDEISGDRKEYLILRLLGGEVMILIRETMGFWYKIMPEYVEYRWFLDKYEKGHSGWYELYKTCEKIFFGGEIE